MAELTISQVDNSLGSVWLEQASVWCFCTVTDCANSQCIILTAVCCLLRQRLWWQQQDELIWSSSLTEGKERRVSIFYTYGHVSNVVRQAGKSWKKIDVCKIWNMHVEYFPVMEKEKQEHVWFTIYQVRALSSEISTVISPEYHITLT